MAVYKCPECGFLYDEKKGNPHEGMSPGTLWSSIPQDYACPSCSVRERDDFEVVADLDQVKES